MNYLPPLQPQQVTRISSRSSFLYLEHCTLGRDGGALTATDADGIIYVPIASVATLMLGPGTRVTHQAMVAMADSGCSVVWVGEQGVRYYAHGSGLSTSDKLARAQALAVSNPRRRLDVVRKMYGLRFPDEDVSGLTTQQLRGREGARLRRLYRTMADEYGVVWTGRQYKNDDFFAADPINQALSAGTACLYGLAHSVITALGCSPALGFIHTGNSRSFVFDVADLYKAETSIPIAFSTIARLTTSVGFNETSLSSVVRYRMRDAFKVHRIAERMVQDIRYLLDAEENGDSSLDLDNELGHGGVIQLWDQTQGSVPGGIQYNDGM